MSKPRILITSVLLLFLTISANLSLAQAPPPVAERKTSPPYDGDLSVFDKPGRAERLQIERVMDILNITPGATVADIGAGSGWFTVRAARRVKETGSVYAVDINPEAVRYVKNRAAREKLNNVHAVLGGSDDPRLPTGRIDAVLILKTYHEIEHPVALLNNLRAALRPAAKIGIIDRNGNGEDHGVSSDIVIQEAEKAGFRLLQRYDFVKKDGMDYFLVFVLKEQQ